MFSSYNLNLLYSILKVKFCFLSYSSFWKSKMLMLPLDFKVVIFLISKYIVNIKYIGYVMLEKNSYALHQSEASTKNHKSLWKIIMIENERDAVIRDSQVALRAISTCDTQRNYKYISSCRSSGNRSYKDLAILNSSYRNKIMHLDTWQIIRVKISFISTSRGFAAGMNKILVL